MSIEARTALYSRLVEVLGDAPAATLMSYLPDSEPATKADIKSLADHTDLRFQSLDDRMDRLDGRMDRLEDRMADLTMTFHSELRAQTRQFILASLGTSATLAVAIVSAAAIL